MAAMKISLDSAMRARDVSEPRAADEAAAEQAEAAIVAGRPGQGARPVPIGRKAGTTADPESTLAARARAEEPVSGDGGPERRAVGRGRRRRAQGRSAARP
jgi:hypothetical protein